MDMIPGTSSRNGPEGALRGENAKAGQGWIVGALRAGKKWLWLMPVLGALWLAPRWWGLVTHPVRVPPTPVAAAREALPALLLRVSAEPRSPDTRLELVAAYSLVGDRLGAWQQLAIAERLR